MRHFLPQTTLETAKTAKITILRTLTSVKSISTGMTQLKILINVSYDNTHLQWSYLGFGYAGFQNITFAEKNLKIACQAYVPRTADVLLRYDRNEFFSLLRRIK